MKKGNLWYWLFLAPTLIALALVVILPLIFGVYYSFTNWNGIDNLKFIGLENYMNLFKDKEFLDSLWFTIKFTVVSVFLINFFGLSLALIVTQKMKTSNLLRTIFFMPNLIGGLILGFIWQFIFIKVFSGVGDLLGIEALKGWLSTPETGFWALAILMSWQMSGYYGYLYFIFRECS